MLRIGIGEGLMDEFFNYSAPTLGVLNLNPVAIYDVCKRFAESAVLSNCRCQILGRLADGFQKPSVCAYNWLNHQMIIAVNQDKTLKLKSKNHITFRPCYHLILTLKYRKNILTPQMQDRLKQIVTTLLVKWECEPLLLNLRCLLRLNLETGQPFEFF